jgi:predicted nucleic-acid-binding Zn-ribbon protein
MAGNTAAKETCLYGPWIKVRGKGIVRSNTTIDMLSEADDYNTDGLIETGGVYSTFFDSSTNYYASESPAPPDYNYSKFYSMTTSSKTTISTSGNLVASSGVYKIDGNYTITSGKIPGTYSTATFNQIVFVNGDMTISSNIKVANSSTALFIVKGNVKISKNVTETSIGIISDGTISTAYDLAEGDYCSTLTLKGIFTANKFLFTRTLQGTKNDQYPSEDITYEPKYAIKLVDYMGSNSIKWVSSD